MAKEDEKKEDEKLTLVGDGSEPSEPSEQEEESKKPVEAAEDSDEKVGHEEEIDEEIEDEGDDSGDPRAKIRERRRREKQRRSQRIASDRRELEFLRKRNETVERTLSQVMLRQDNQETVSIDQRIGNLEGQIREAEGIHSEAITAKDGATATEALRVAAALRESLGQLKNGKEERKKHREQQETAAKTETKVEADPEAIVHGKAWVRENDWFDPGLQDEDSYIARAIEERLAREGTYDPKEPEYWEELNRRIDKRMPNLRKKKGKVADDTDDDDERKEQRGKDVEWDEDDEKPQKKPTKKAGGPRFSVGGKTRALKPNEVYISAERKKALMEAGVWEDEEKRERYLRSYKKYDEDAAQRNS